ncbi:cysteine--tRNA ligase [Saccharospirillum alexandrii]|uniref:cysteine--tRNA ligase n=1 Tax=Saccharospirillum alexandrii TaxID=2448477 RepID=UPI000FD76ECF|nr:cysteine--tRNA ligase [Saccharospirillum alexandrii]
MTLTVYNTLSGKKEPFVPLDPNRVTFYACGPTVYNYIHVGNGRSAVVFDLLYRLLKTQFSNVIFARNLTDIDDKINASAKAEGVDIKAFADTYATAYQEDMAALGNLDPTLQPRATEHIPQIIDIIERLIDRDHAYAAEGHVLFAVDSMKDYGQLSRRNIDDMLAGARVDVATYKRHPMDFVLWKPSSDDLPGWDSPWGRGRPGWHIECTAMIMAHLGDTIDIHGGGSDLIFPHHENEMAQGLCCVPDSQGYARYWVHNAMLDVEGEKMSKSLGNFTVLRDVLNEHPGEVVRLTLLSAHYRSNLNWSEQLLSQSRQTLDRLYTVLRDSQDIAAVEPADLSSLEAVQALLDDLNTPRAIAALYELTGQFFKTTDNAERARLKGELIAITGILGIAQQDPMTWFHGQQQDGLQPEAIEALIQQRQDAKKAKDFARADAIREELKQAGILIQDTREGTQWSREA